MTLQSLKLWEKDNQYLKNDLIPQGRNSFWDRYFGGLPNCSKYSFDEQRRRPQVCLKYKRNGVIVFLGGSSSGKSVRLKSVLTWFAHPKYFGGKYPRSSIVFDLQGEDHRLNAFANGSQGNSPFPLVKNFEKPIGFGKENVINYTPSYAKEFLFDYKDKIFAFPLSDIHVEDFMSMKITDASVTTLHKIINLNPELALYPKAFLSEFEKLTVSNKEDDESLLRMEERLNESIKLSLLGRLWRWVHDEAFMSEKMRPTIFEDMAPGKIVTINFHEDRRYASLYVSVLARMLYNHSREMRRKKGVKHLNPILVLEEPQVFLDMNDRAGDSGGNRWVTNYLKQGNKFQNLVFLATQAMKETPVAIRNHAVMQEVLVSSPTPNDLQWLNTVWSSEVMEVIRTLRSEPPLREWALVHGGGKYVETFYSNNSMTQIHLR